MRKKLSSVEQELAVSRALSALCGGSGVGQAPELPYKAEVHGEDKLQVETISLQGSGSRSRTTPEPPTREASVNYDFTFQDEKILRFAQNDRKAIFLPIAPDIKSKNPKTLKPEEKFPSSKLKVSKRTDFRQVTRSFLTMASVFLILMSVVGFVFTFGPVIRAEVGFRAKNFQFSIFNFQKNKNDKTVGIRENPLEISENPRVNKQKLPNILPVTAVKEIGSINFPASSSIVIPKIDAQAEFFVNTDVANYDEYISVLQKGVAHASGTALPGEVGNSYFFAHSAGNLFDVARFNAVFYLISKLEKGDAIYVAFGNQKFKYTVYEKKEVDPTDTEYLNNRKDNGRMLTLQTCTPPGTDWRRLLVFAKIEE